MFTVDLSLANTNTHTQTLHQSAVHTFEISKIKMETEALVQSGIIDLSGLLLRCPSMCPNLPIVANCDWT